MEYPSWICHKCGLKYGKNFSTQTHIATFHIGDKCGWCGTDQQPVTEPRDYGYPSLPKKENKNNESVRTEAGDIS